MTRHVAVQIAAAAAVALGAATYAGSASAAVDGSRVVVEDLGKGRAVIDGHRTPRPWERQSLAQLIRRWGEPDKSRAISEGVVCIAMWRSPRVVAHLVNLGLIPDGETACSPDVGRIQWIETAGPGWVTRRGVRTGARLSALRKAYPKAIPQPRSSRKIWLLRPYVAPCIGDCGPGTYRSSGVVAVIRAGKVSSFAVRVGAGGD